MPVKYGEAFGFKFSKNDWIVGEKLSLDPCLKFDSTSSLIIEIVIKTARLNDTSKLSLANKFDVNIREDIGYLFINVTGEIV